MCFLNLSCGEICYTNDKNNQFTLLREKNFDESYISLLRLMVTDNENNRPDFI